MIFMKARPLLLLFLSMFSCLTSAQNAPVNLSEVGFEKEELLFITSEAMKTFSAEAKPSSVRNNSEVFISQVGDANIVNTAVFSENVRMDLRQQGSSNDMQMKVLANNVNYNVQQRGNYNNLFDFTSVPSQSAILNLEQQGNDLHVEKYGTNSITNKLEFKVTGDYKSLIITSFQ